eukprot:1577141-Prorocentrum_lima.AAC.1
MSWFTSTQLRSEAGPRWLQLATASLTVAVPESQHHVALPHPCTGSNGTRVRRLCDGVASVHVVVRLADRAGS